MTPTPRSFAPGAAVKDGKLYLFCEESALVVRPWPDSRAWRLGLEGPWKGARPVGLDLGAPDKLGSRSRLRRRCEAQAFASIPRERRRAAARFGDRGWPLHNLFTRVPGALGLAEHCPALAAGLAFSHHLRAPVNKPLRSARALLRSPGSHTARDVAAWLGFEPSRAVVRVLRKLEPCCCDAGSLRLVREALQHRHLRKALLHAGRLRQPALVLLGWAVDSAWQPGLDAAVVTAVARLDFRGGWDVVASIQNLVPMWADLWPDRPLPRLVSVDQIARLDALVEAEVDSPRFLHRLAQSFGGFPAPPLLGGLVEGFRFEPLCSVDDLVSEGRAMEHCIGSRPYVSGCARGEGYGYRVEPVAPPLVGQLQNRATVWLERDEGKPWKLTGLQSKGNEEPSYMLRTVVERWLQCQDSASPVQPSPEETAEAAPGPQPLQARERPRPVRRLQARQPPPAMGRQLGLWLDMPF